MKYIKYSFLAALGLLFAQCTEEGDKTYPQQPAPQWSVVEEDFVSETPTWQGGAAPPPSAPPPVKPATSSTAKEKKNYDKTAVVAASST